MAVDPKLVQALFLQTIELPTTDRLAFLDQQCAGNSELRAQIETILFAHDLPDSVLDRPLLPGNFAAPSVAKDFAPNSRVGPYRIVERLGGGAWGRCVRGRRTWKA